MDQIGNSIKYLFDLLKRLRVRRVVYTESLAHFPFFSYIENAGFDCTEIADARTAAYVATGMCAETHSPIVLCCDGSNEARSLLSGLTEAYYRSLPVIAVTASYSLTPKQEKALNDASQMSVTIKNGMPSGYANDQIKHAVEFAIARKYPIHVDFSFADYDGAEVQREDARLEKRSIPSKIVTEIANALDEQCYLFISNYIDMGSEMFKCRVVKNTPENGIYGSVSVPFGAALSGSKRKYAAIITDKELEVDINTLGNRHVNRDFVLFVCSSKAENISVCMNYCNSLNYRTLKFNGDAGQIHQIMNGSEVPTLCVIEV